MANPIIQNYLNDESVPMEMRKSAYQALQSKKLDEAGFAKFLANQNNKYVPNSKLDSNLSAEERGGFMAGVGKVAKGAGNLAIGVGKGALTTASTLSSIGEKGLQAVGKAILPKSLEEKAGISEPLSELPTSGGMLKQSGALEAKGTMQNIGKFAEQIGEFFIPGGAAAKGAKLLQATNVAKNLSNVSKVGKFVNPIIRLGAESIGAGVIGSVQEGSISEGGKTAGLTAGLGVAGKAITAVGKPLANKIFSSLIPTTITQRGSDFVKKINIGEAVSRTGISFSKNKLLTKIIGLKKNLGNQLEDAIETTMKTTDKKININSLVNSIKGQILKSDVKRLGATPADMKKVVETIDDVVRDYRTLYKGKEFDLKDLQELKRALGTGLDSQYAKVIGASLKAKPLTEMRLRSNIQKLIEKHVPDAGKINKQLAPLITATKRLEAKGNYSGYLTDLLVGSLYASSSSDILENPVKFLKNVVVGVIGKRVLLSTGGKTTGATLLKNIDKVSENKALIQSLREIIQELDDQEDFN